MSTESAVPRICARMLASDLESIGVAGGAWRRSSTHARRTLVRLRIWANARPWRTFRYSGKSCFHACKFSSVSREREVLVGAARRLMQLLSMPQSRPMEAGRFGSGRLGSFCTELPHKW